MGTVNNLMEIDEEILDTTQETNSVVTSLEQQVTNVQQNPENFTEIENNVGVQAVKLDPHVTNAVTFVNFPPVNVVNGSVLSADLSEEYTELYNDVGEVEIPNSTSSIFIPRDILDLAQKGNMDIPT